MEEIAEPNWCIALPDTLSQDIYWPYIRKHVNKCLRQCRDGTKHVTHKRGYVVFSHPSKLSRKKLLSDLSLLFNQCYFSLLALLDSECQQLLSSCRSSGCWSVQDAVFDIVLKCRLANLPETEQVFLLLIGCFLVFNQRA